MTLKKIFEQAQIGQMRLKNRLVCPPMARGFATEDGLVTPQTLHHYEALAKGGVGLLIVEATCVESPRGKGWEHALVVDDDRFIPGFKELARVIHDHGAKAAVQLQHAGLATSAHITHMRPVGPSALSLPGFDPGRQLAIQEIRDIVTKFAQAAKRVKNAGFDGVEIHGAHTYLLAQFLSPAINKRQDAYGGSFENRSRFLLEVLEATRKLVGNDFPVWCRMNGIELGIENGFTMEEAQLLAMRLEKGGADALHVSAGAGGKYKGYGSGVMYDPPGNLMHLAEYVKRVVRIPVIAVGKLNLVLAEEILQQGRADFAAMGRSLLADPDLPQKAAENRLEDIRPCLWCRTCGDIFLHAKRTGIRCQVNAALGRERESELKKSKLRKRVLVIGGGPAGMEAARVTSLRGHEVILCEREARLGGQMIFASLPPFKTPIRDFAAFLESQLNKLGVKIELGREITPDLVEALKPETAILATGVTPFIPKIPGTDRPHVISAEDVLRGKIEAAPKSVIIGGGRVGAEIADYLSEKGKEVTVIEMLPAIAAGMGMRMRTRLLDRLESKGVKLLTRTLCQEIGSKSLACCNMDGDSTTVEAGTVIIAAGSKPNRELYGAISDLVSESYLIGDCVAPASILEAVADGFRLGRLI